MSACAVVWCDRSAVARGLCKRCYARYKRGLGPNETRQYTTRETKERVRVEVTQRRESGQSIADIAAGTGVNASTLGKWLREWGVAPASGRRGQSLAPNRWKPWTAEEISVAVDRTDLTVSERAALLGRSISAIEEALRDHRRRSDDIQH